MGIYNNYFPFLSFFPSMPKQFSPFSIFFPIYLCFSKFFSSVHKIDNKKNRKQITFSKFSNFCFSLLIQCLLKFRTQLSLFRTFPTEKMCLTNRTSTCRVVKKLKSMKVWSTTEPSKNERCLKCYPGVWDLAYFWFDK